MIFCKNKAKIIIYYCVVFLLLAVLVAIVGVLVFDNVARIVIMEIMSVVLVLPFIKLGVAEINQTVELGNKEIVCKNFIINGNVANGKIDYRLIESIKMKNDLLKPFSKCLHIKVKNEKPFALTDDYIEYKELWGSLCLKCKEANPDVFIDESIFKKINTRPEKTFKK